MLRCVPGKQQGGAGAQWADQVHGQLPSLVVRQREASLNVLQGADVLGPPPAGVHALAEHQLVADVPAGWTGGGGGGGGGGWWLIVRWLQAGRYKIVIVTLQQD